MRTVRLEATLGTLGTLVVLCALAATADLGVAGWVVGLLVGLAATALLAAARVRSEEPRIFPADWITLARALLTAGVAGLVADSFDRSISVIALQSTMSRPTSPPTLLWNSLTCSIPPPSPPGRV